MRVMLVTGEYPPDEGGVADYTRCLAEALAEHGVDVVVVTSGGDGPDVNVDASVAVRRDAPPWGWGVLRWLGQAVRRTDVDWVHIQYQAAAFGMRPAIHLMPWALASSTTVQTAVTYHDLREPYLFPKAGSVRRWAVRALARYSDLTMATNAADFSDLQAWGGANHLSLVPIGSNVPDLPSPNFDRGAWRRDAGVGDDQGLVAYFGFLNASKGAMDLVTALGHLVEAGHDVRLVMIGGQVGASDPTNAAYLESVRHELNARGLAERVIWTGHVPRPDVSAWLHAADAVALPYEDGASMRRGSLLAALAHGVPIVTTEPPTLPNAPGAPPPLVDGKSARLVPAGDAAALTSALAEVLRDDALQARLSAGAHELAAAFGWSAIAQRHVDEYRSL